MPKIKDPGNFDQWIALAKVDRQAWQTANKSDMPPMVYSCRDNECIAQIISPQVDRDLGLKAAELCRYAMAADRIVIFFDARTITKKAQEMGQGLSEEEFKKKFHNFKLDKMCKEENAKEMGLVVDCISIYMATTTEMRCHSLPYVIDGGELGWYDEEEVMNMTVKMSDFESENADNFDDAKANNKIMMKGIIPETMHAIMTGPTVLENASIAKSAEVFKFDRDKQIFHTTRAALKLLAEQKYFVVVKDQKLVPQGAEQLDVGDEPTGNPRFKI